MVDLKFVVVSTFLILIKVTAADININVIARDNGNISIIHSGTQVDLITDSDIDLFDISTERLEDAVYKDFGIKPSDVYLKSPTPWGDLYKSYKWEQVTRVLSIKSARALRLDKKPVIVTSQVFDNESKKNIKVNAAINHSVENTVTSSWTKSSEIQTSLGLEVKVGFVTASMGYSTSFSHGRSEEKSKSAVIGISTGVEIELEPGQAAIASLSANEANLEIEVVYTAVLRGKLALNFSGKYRGHYFWADEIGTVMKCGDIVNEKTIVQRIKFGYYSEAKLKVFDSVLKTVLWSNTDN